MKMCNKKWDVEASNQIKRKRTMSQIYTCETFHCRVDIRRLLERFCRMIKAFIMQSCMFFQRTLSFSGWLIMRNSNKNLIKTSQKEDVIHQESPVNGCISQAGSKEEVSGPHGRILVPQRFTFTSGYSWHSVSVSGGHEGWLLKINSLLSRRQLLVSIWWFPNRNKESLWSSIPTF